MRAKEIKLPEGLPGEIREKLERKFEHADDPPILRAPVPVRVVQVKEGGEGNKPDDDPGPDIGVREPNRPIPPHDQASEAVEMTGKGNE